MSGLPDSKAPVHTEAEAHKSAFGLVNHGLTNLGQVYWNLSAAALDEAALRRGEGRITAKPTMGTPDDKFVVRGGESEERVWWGEYNRPFSPEKFSLLLAHMQGFWQQRDLFVQDCYVGADANYRLPVRIITEHAGHSLLARNMLFTPDSVEELRSFVPSFTVICAPSFEGVPSIDSTNSQKFSVFNFEQRIALIGGATHAGEIKKAVWGIINYLMYLQGVMPLQGAASIGQDGEVALFLGRLATEKTALASDKAHKLLGGDAHGWSDEGIFGYDHAAAPSGGMAGHPKHIFLLTCDAMGVLPPLARLTSAQAAYYFLAGYSAVAGGAGEMIPAFSACFDAPGAVQHPVSYADLLQRKIARYGVSCWLINTAEVVGGVGKCGDLQRARALLEAIFAGKLADVPYRQDEVFGFAVPTQCEGMTGQMLDPSTRWEDKTLYRQKRGALAARFNENFKKFAGDCSPELRAAGPIKS